MPRGDVLWQRLEPTRPAELRKLGEILRLAGVGEKSPPALVEEISRDSERPRGTPCGTCSAIFGDCGAD